jgi:hypothetical protein
LIDPAAMPAFGHEQESNGSPGDDLVALAEQKVDDYRNTNRGNGSAGSKSRTEVSEQYHGCGSRLFEE